MEKKVQKMRLIYEGSRKMALALELDEIYNRALELACTALEADGGSVMILDEKTSELVVKTASGSRKEIAIGKRLKLGERFAGHAAQMKSPLFMHDVADEPWFKSLKKFEEIKSGMSIPLLVRDKLVGVINLKRTQRDEKFAKNDVGLVSILADYVASIIERKRAEEELRESEERYRDLFENANDLIQSVNNEGKFVYVNRKWLEVLGYTKEEVKKLTLWDILRKDQIQHCMEIFKKVCRGEAVDQVETVFVSKNGKEIPVSGSGDTQFKDGKFIATRGIFRDITERKKMEEERIKAAVDRQRMEELEKFAKVAVGRELRMVELKERIKELEEKLEAK